MKRQIQLVNVYNIDLYHCGQEGGMSEVFMSVCVRMDECLSVFLGKIVCLCMSPSLMHGQCVYWCCFYHNVIITDTCKKCKLKIVEFELFLMRAVHFFILFEFLNEFMTV